MAQVGKSPTSPFVEGTEKLVDSLAYLKNLITQSKDHVKTATAGPEGTVYHASVEGLAETVKAMESHIQSFELLEMQDVLTNFSLFAFVNESRKEHGFAKHKQKGQYRHPTQQQYVHSKGRHEIELLKKICQSPHAYHTNSFSSYQPTHQSGLSSVKTIAMYKKWSEKFHPHKEKISCKEAKRISKLQECLMSLPSQDHPKTSGSPCVVTLKSA